LCCSFTFRNNGAYSTGAALEVLHVCSFLHQSVTDNSLSVQYYFIHNLDRLYYSLLIAIKDGCQVKNVCLGNVQLMKSTKYIAYRRTYSYRNE